MNANRPPRPDALDTVAAELARWNLPEGDVRHELQNAVRWVELDPRQELYSQGDPVTAVYFLYEGGIFQERITQDDTGRRRVTLRREAKHGEWIGHYDLLYAQQYSANTRALGFAGLVEVQAAALNRLLHRYPLLRTRIASMDRIGRLRTIPLFGHLDLIALSYLADACTQEVIPAHTVLYDESQLAERIFVVDQGQVALTSGDLPPTWLGNGMAFGFLKRPISRPDDPPAYDHQARTTVTSKIIVIPRQALSMIVDIDVEEHGAKLRREVLETVARIPVFSAFTPEEQRAVLGYMSHYHLPTNHLLMQQGEVGDSLWVLLDGSRATLHALHRGEALQPTLLQGPNFFEDIALKSEQPIQSTVQAEPHSRWLRLHRDDLRTFGYDHGWQLVEKVQISPTAVQGYGEDAERKRYPWLQPNENLIVFQRRHLLALAFRLITPTVLTAITLVLYLVALGQGWLLAWVGWGTAALLGVAALQVAWGVVDYLNDYLLVTNQRLVRQEKVLLITEHRQAAFLEQIRSIDVTTDFFGNLFGYGLLTIQTAATNGAIRFDFMSNALAVKQRILEQQNLRQQHYQASNRMIIQNLLEDRFGLRLQLPARVRPEIPLPPRPEPKNWRERARQWLDVDGYLSIRVDDRIIWRKHWFILIGALFGPVSILLTILLLLIGQQWLPAALAPYILPFDIVLVLIGLVAMAWLAWNVTDWRNDTYEVDNRQVVDVEKKPLFFSEQRRTALLGEIENIEVSIPSPIHYLFNFGNVRLQTAAAQGEFTFDWVPDPRGVAEEIRRRIEQYRYQQETNRARQRAQELPDWFEMYNRLEADSAQLWPESKA